MWAEGLRVQNSRLRLQGLLLWLRAHKAFQVWRFRIFATRIDIGFLRFALGCRPFKTTLAITFVCVSVCS